MRPERQQAPGADETRAADAATPPSTDITVWLAAEALGAGLMTFFIIAAGTLGERFAGGNIGLAMLMTCLAGAGAFAGLARALGGIAPSAFNPVLALALLLGGRMALLPALLAAAAQIAGAFLGVMIAHLATNTGLVQAATQIQTGLGIWAGEFVATAFFTFVIVASTAWTPVRAAFIGAACLLAISLATPSLSFANPAVTLARTLTDSFTSIRLVDGGVICAVQLLGAVAAFLLARALLPGTRGENALH